MAQNMLDKKLEYWEHQLLDLGKRNRMINYRETKRSTIKLVEPSFDELFERLALNDETLSFQRAVDRETDIRVFSILSLLENLSEPLPVAIGDIKTEGSVLERQKTLRNLRSKARLALEEQGTNILYLSFGFIEWKDGKGASAQWIKSPLILVPAELTLKALNSPYELKKLEDDIVLNPTLEYYLKTEYGIELPVFDADNDTLDGYLTRLEEIADKRGWRILREVSLGLLSFLKITMYNDLIRNKDRIMENPVIRAMAGDLTEVNQIPEELQSFELDSISTQDSYQVMSADSSQQESILYSKHNISFVMQGPPGTGKSQTITNIIAEALAEGKKILFVSEKMAALQVVYRRLQDAHLGEFCLPLHSYKANKKEILEQIGANLNMKQVRVRDSAITNLEELLAIRNDLNRYASQLHTIIPPLNVSCYEVYSRLESVKDAPTITFPLPNPLETTQSGLQAYLNVLNVYSLTIERLRYFIKDNPWEGLISRMTGYEYTEKMRLELGTLCDHLIAVSKLLSTLNNDPETVSFVKYKDIPLLIENLRDIGSLPALPDRWFGDFDITLGISEAEECKILYRGLFALRDKVDAAFYDGISKFDCDGWKKNLQELAGNFVGAPLVGNNPPECYINNAESFKEAFSALHQKLIVANNSFAGINSLLGTSFAANTANLQIITELLSLIRGNVILRKSWFSDDLRKLKALVIDAKSVAMEYTECKDVLNANWEQEIFQLDYKPMLTRYKTAHTGIFKVFSSQYHADRKQLRALSKKVLKKFSDEDAVELLTLLKIYHENASWLESRKEELSTALSSYFTGVDSQWDYILAAIGIVENLTKLPFGGVSGQLMEMLSNDHKVQVECLEKLLSDAMKAFTDIRSIIAKRNIILNIDAPEFNGAQVAETAVEYVARFDSLLAQRNLIVPYLRDTNSKVTKIFEDVDSVNALRMTRQNLKSSDCKLADLFSFLYVGENTDWELVIDLLNDVHRLRQSPYFRFIQPIMNASKQKKEEILSVAENLSAALAQERDCFEWIGLQFSKDLNLPSLRMSQLLDKAQGCLRNIDLLEKWIDYQEAKDACGKENLGEFIQRIEDKAIFEGVEGIFLKGFYHMWLNAAFEKMDSVRCFRKNVQDERVKKFVELDNLQLPIAQHRIRERLIEGLPDDHHLVRATDEVGVLKRELGKKRNIMPLRKLFRMIPNLLMKLKPCLMMSPLSVSYFLETEAYHFDLVIFDEASQIFPEDAIGAIFRASQVIIAGDSKQLPPTNFFSSTTNNNDGDYDINEDDFVEVVSDSILEEAASVLPNLMLSWHYRSKHESLIAFSNREIYLNNLVTFPNSINNVPDMGVEYIYVNDGVYDRGGKKNNVREAETCVELVFSHIRKYPERSLGIIAFSESQQTTIENAIVDYRERHPEYEWFFDETKDEPFFIKNLENVQGDERDTIIFSICYGRDRNGNMYMNFGPVGHSGGERRLNVAITRAKCNIKLVGSILPEDIDVDRAKSEGARMLRSYIAYAMKGTSALRPVDNAETFEVNDDFSEIVAKFLELNGYTVERHVGCSAYKIDIAVKNTKCDSEYIAGIECDGLSYTRARTARDRDHLRRAVLQNMGWNLYRVWSTEWYRNPVAEGEALLSFLQSVYDKDGNVIHGIKQSNETSGDKSVADIATETEKEKTETENNPYGFSYYREANWWEADYQSAVDNLGRVAEIIYHIVNVEQPIHLDMLYKRIGPSFQTGKATDAVKRTIAQAMTQRLEGRITVDEERFVHLLPHSEVTVRIPALDETPRPFEYIHTQEVARAMIAIIERSFGITEEDLASECARIFGFERKGPKIKAKSDAAIRWLVEQKKIRIIEGKVQRIGD